MVQVMSRYDAALEKGRLASERIAAYTWTASADKTVVAIQQHLSGGAERKPQTLNSHEYRVTSQNGEDGLIAEIFDRVDTEFSRFCEIGVGDPHEQHQGQQNNTRELARIGWIGTWIDAADQPDVPDGVEFVRAFVTRDTVDALVPRDIDLLSMEIDGNDYWIWEAITARPRVVIIEYNSRVDSDYIMRYDESHQWDYRSVETGAGIDALCDLGRRKGYTLVATDRSGVNAFFVRDDLIADRFPEPVCVHEYAH
jgi:hypothetical protein